MTTPTSRTLTRRSVTSGLAWSVPAVAAVSAAPFAAASVVAESGGQYGLFVTTSLEYGLGYYPSRQTGVVNPTTPEAHFDALAAGANPEADIAWNDASACHTAARYANGEGSFTPTTNSVSGSSGSYATSSGFWWSVPTTDVASGTGYIPGSTATLESGATFTTEIELIVPAHQYANWTVSNIKVAGKLWNGPLTGTNTSGGTRMATYLQMDTVSSTWSLTAPTVTTLADGSLKVTGTLTVTTTVDATVTQTGSTYYGQTVIMPADFEVNPAYGWSSFSLTSYVQNATITYTGQAADAPSSVSLAGDLLTNSTITPKAC